jgi:PilZ domain
LTYPTVSPLQLILMERRSKARYPLMLKIRYRSLGRKLHLGEGQAVNLSSGGALIDSRHELSVGEVLEVCMEWPSLLDGCIPLQLVAVAKVVRCGPSSFAVRFRRYQFRTLRCRVQPIPISVFSAPRRRAAK